MLGLSEEVIVGGVLATTVTCCSGRKLK